MMTVPYPFLAVVFLLGVVVGSFLNALVWRMPRHISILERHSTCPRCKHALASRDLVPLLSFFLLGGRCRFCHKPISWRYPAVELTTGLLPLLILGVYGWSWAALAIILLTLFLEALFLLDTSYHIVPDSVSIPGMVLALVVSLILGRPFGAVAVGAILGTGVFLAQYVVSKGKWIGDGDIRLGALMGLALGWKLLLVALLLSYVSGAIVGSALVALHRKRWKSQIPFGSFLTPATLAALLWGDALLDAYLHFLGA